MKKRCERCGRTGNWLDLCNTRRGDTEHYHGFSPGGLCRDCHIDILDDPELFYPQLLDDEFEFFFSAASGTSRNVLELMEESHTLVSYLTTNNGRIGPEEHHYIDSGGNPATFLGNEGVVRPEYPDSNSDYLDYVEATASGRRDLWALRDYPVVEKVLKKFDVSVEDMQELTVDDHRDLLNQAADRDVSARPVSVLQGSSVREYLLHIDMLRDHGALTNYVGIGSFALASPDYKRDVILAVRDALPQRVDIHGLGVSLSTLQKDHVVNALSSADSGGWISQRMNAADDPAWDTDQQMALKPGVYQYLEYTKDLGEVISAAGVEATNQEASTLATYSDSESPYQRDWAQSLSGDIRRIIEDYTAGELERGAASEHPASDEQTGIDSFKSAI